MIHFAAYTAAETPTAFHWAGQPPKTPLLVGMLIPIYDMVPFGPTRVRPQQYLHQFDRLAGLKNVTNRHTDRQTDHAIPSVCRNRPHLVIAVMRPNNNVHDCVGSELVAAQSCNYYTWYFESDYIEVNLSHEVVFSQTRHCGTDVRRRNRLMSIDSTRQVQSCGPLVGERTKIDRNIVPSRREC